MAKGKRSKLKVYDDPAFIDNGISLFATSTENQHWFSKKKDYSDSCEASLISGIKCCHPFDCVYAINITPNTVMDRETRVCCGRAFKPFEANVKDDKNE